MRSRLPPLHTLRVFESIYRRGSLRQAADELCLTPQAVSQQLKQLEAALGQALFERNIRSVTPTKAAHLFYEPVKHSFDLLAEGLMALDKQGERKVLDLHVSPYFATRFLIKNLGNFAAEFPEVDVRMSIGVELPNMQDGSIDAAIHWGYGGIPHLCELPLVEDLKVLVAAPDLLARTQLARPEDLLQHTLVAPIAASTLWRDTFELLGVQPRAKQPTLHMHTQDAMLEAVRAGLGVGHVSYLDAMDQIRAGKLVAPFGVDVLRQLPLDKMPKFFLYYKADRKHSPVLRRFAQWLQDYLCQPEVLGFESRCAAPTAATQESHPG